MRLQILTRSMLAIWLLLIVAALIAACETSTIPATVDAETREDVILTARVITREAVLRKRPDVNSEMMTRLPKDTVVEVYEEQGPWYRIHTSGTTGWILKVFLATEEASAIPASPQLTPTLVESSPPAATLTVPAALVITPSLVLPLTPSPSPQPTPQPPKPSPRPDAVVDTDVLNVREGPGTGFRRIAQIRQSDVLKVLGQANNCRWLKVITPDDIRGWVSADYVRLNLQCTHIPRVPTPTRRPPTPTLMSPPTPTWTPTLRPPSKPTWTPRPPGPPPTRIPTCATPVGKVFAGLWNQQPVHSRLGCPTGPSHQSISAVERFQRGFMLWRDSSDTVYVLFDDGTWLWSQDRFIEGTDPEYPCGEHASPPSARRGFGKVWCSHPGVRAKIGNAVEREAGYGMSGGGPIETFQDFKGGMMYKSNHFNAVYALFDDGIWRRQ